MGFKFEIEFSVNGKRTSSVVTARDSFDAKKLILAQYSDAKVMFYHIKK